MRRRAGGSTRLEFESVDVEEIAFALQDQTGYEQGWLIDPRSGCGPRTGIDGRTPVELNEVDLLPIDPLPSRVCGSTGHLPETDRPAGPEQETAVSERGPNAMAISAASGAARTRRLGHKRDDPC